MHHQNKDSLVTISSSLEFKALLRSILKFFLILLAIQTVRAAAVWAFTFFFRPDFNSSLWVWLDIVLFPLLGLGIYLIFRPSLDDLGLSLEGEKKSTRQIYLVLVILLVGLVVSSIMYGTASLLDNFRSVLIVPLLEEFLFRGLGWTRIESALHTAQKGWITWLIVTFLFGVWHLGYADVLYLHVLPHQPSLNIPQILFFKVLVGWIIGAAVGFLRWRTGKVYSSVFLHGLWNVFGR
jgi:membrane protease YdiL (CAAX protease family)